MIELNKSYPYRIEVDNPYAGMEIPCVPCKCKNCVSKDENTGLCTWKIYGEAIQYCMDNKDKVCETLYEWIKINL